MAAISPASRLITAAARERLRPLGLRQQGRSRIWIDDHGWWITVVEFSSPRWSQGSGLTVGAMWLWQDLAHLAFDFHEQVRTAEDFRNERQFTSAAATLAQEAEQRIEDFRTRFADLNSAATTLIERPSRTGYLWEDFNAGIAAALTGQPGIARHRLARIQREDPIADWITELQQTARTVSELAEDTTALQDWAQARITSCREKLSLPPLPNPLSTA
ncbi:hypothetical protein GCM10010329_84090 [Streptomyces spiroverticillatus]|uniref:Uncharacterized protein n=1 Tax=Streptomyces finlayi TaxID=67296 RepID=A0A919CG11_9ACTN|nr:hypothetical protein [Streptomyces finlayi]GHA48958.1 hypothetical protein GCM10010329_84090 [Streptomyces spiroverticillatus]GHD19263.1 hypothetical protein GCM10010334_82760 [Streptomyces finlayi]